MLLAKNNTKAQCETNDFCIIKQLLCMYLNIFLLFFFASGKYGMVEFTLQYDPNTQELLVIVHKCKVSCIYDFKHHYASLWVLILVCPCSGSEWKKMREEICAYDKSRPNTQKKKKKFLKTLATTTKK